MLRIAIIPTSLLFAYVFFTPIEPLELVDSDFGANLSLPDGPEILPVNPAYANRVEVSTVAKPVVENRGKHKSADIAQVLTEFVEANSQEESPAESAAEYEYAIPDMAFGQTFEVAVRTADVDEPAVAEPSFEEPSGDGAPSNDASANEGAEDGAVGETAESETPTLPKPEPKPELTPAMAAVRDRLRRTTATFYRHTLSPSENTSTDLMHYCLAFGCESQIVYGSSSSAKKLNGITHLCWNYPCGGFEPLTLSDGRIAARLGYGLQQTPSQLLAVLALSRVKTDYPARVGEHVATVAELVEHEKVSCRSGDDFSLKLIGLSYYVEEPTWTNRLGEEWSIERMVEEELDKTMRVADVRGTNRLIGLSRALAERVQRDLPVEGQFQRARKFLDEYHDYALALQNTDGSWGPRFLAAKGTSRDEAEVLHSTGHVLQWLVLSLPEEQLEDPRIVRSIEYVGRLLGSSRYRRGVRSLSTREIGSVMHALHALMVYDRRYLAPRTPEPTENEAAS